MRNLERDPRATLQVEAGEQYEELRGVMLECEVVIHRDRDGVRARREIFARYAVPRGEPPVAELHAEVGEMVDKQAPSAWRWSSSSAAAPSWDHRKLGGVY